MMRSRLRDHVSPNPNPRYRANSKGPGRDGGRGAGGGGGAFLGFRQLSSKFSPTLRSKWTPSLHASSTKGQASNVGLIWVWGSFPPVASFSAKTATMAAPAIMAAVWHCHAIKSQCLSYIKATSLLKRMKKLVGSGKQILYLGF